MDPALVDLILEALRQENRIPHEARRVVIDLCILGMKEMTEYCKLREELLDQE